MTSPTPDINAVMAEMERLAKAVSSPGPWNGGHRCDGAIRAGASGDRYSLAEVYARADAAFIAAANPVAIFALLAHDRAETARADAAESERDSFKAACKASVAVIRGCEARVAALVEALEPMKIAAGKLGDHIKDCCPIGTLPMIKNDGLMLCAGDLRRAALVIADTPDGVKP